MYCIARGQFLNRTILHKCLNINFVSFIYSLKQAQKYSYLLYSYVGILERKILRKTQLSEILRTILQKTKQDLASCHYYSVVSKLYFLKCHTVFEIFINSSSYSKITTQLRDWILENRLNLFHFIIATPITTHSQCHCEAWLTSLLF